MVAISISLTTANYDRLRAICESSSNMKMSQAVNWMVQLGNARRQELEAQDNERLAKMYKEKGIDGL